MILLHPDVLDAIRIVHSYASEVSDWLEIKKELLKIVRSSHRANFSNRDKKTKVQNINDYDRAVAEEWWKLTSRPVFLMQKKTITQVFP